MKSITIQPKEQSNMTLPYPYHIDKKGFVGRQEFWKGNPTNLIGFAKNPKVNEIELSLADFLKIPDYAVGLYPVFNYKNGDWKTDVVEIESISVNK